MSTDSESLLILNPAEKTRVERERKDTKDRKHTEPRRSRHRNKEDKDRKSKHKDKDKDKDKKSKNRRRRHKDKDKDNDKDKDKKKGKKSSKDPKRVRDESDVNWSDMPFGAVKLHIINDTNLLREMQVCLSIC